MRNHFFLILVLASLLAFVQKFAGGEISLAPILQRVPASAADYREVMVSVEEVSPAQEELN